MLTKKSLVWCTVFLVLVAEGASAAPAQVSTEEDEVTAVLRAAEQAWNRRDKESYMQTYEHSEKVRQLECGRLTAGWSAINENLTSIQGALNFPDIRVELLTPSAAVARVLWSVEKDRGGKETGVPTLGLVKTIDGWKIAVEFIEPVSGWKC